MKGNMKLQKAFVGFLALFTFCNCARALSKTVAWSSRTARTPWTLLLLLTLPAVVQAQFTYMTNNGTITITGYTGPGGAVVIPDRIPDTTNGLPVTTIGGYAFYFREMTSVIIPSSVISIGSHAFDSCKGLGKVIIPNSVIIIGDHAFDTCIRLTNVMIPDSVISIGEYAFSGCGLTNITIGSGLTGIEDYTFDHCSLTTITIPSSVTSIGDGAFWGGDGLTGVYFWGNAPIVSVRAFIFNDLAKVYYLPGTTGWTSSFGGRPTVLWNPQAQAAGVRTNGYGFTITGTTNIPIVVEASTNLASATWTPLQSCTITDGSIYFSDPLWTNYTRRFYRLRSP
jgi:hypothetical protein